MDSDIVTCPICTSKFSISTFFEHFKIHSSHKGKAFVKCTHKNCAVKLTSLSSFRTHISRQHRKISNVSSTSADAVGEGAITCPIDDCDFNISSRRLYLEHMPSHFSVGQKFTCIFNDCVAEMRNVQQFRTHVCRYHPGESFITKKPTLTTESAEEASCEMDFDVGEESGFPSEGDELSNNDIVFDANIHVDTNSDPYPSNMIKDELARFYLKLEAVHLLPSSTVQIISEEIKLITELMHFKLKKALKEQLEKCNMEKHVTENIISNTFKDDPIFNVHHKGKDEQQLGTDHLRIKYWQQAFNFVEPERIFLGHGPKNKNKYAHMVSMRKSLSAMLRDEEVKKMVLKSFIDQGKILESPSAEQAVLKDFTDGSIFKDHLKSHEHDGKKCLQIFMFHDAFDTQAFGFGGYKPLAFYYVLGNLPAEIRTRLELIQLAYLVLEKDLKPTEAEELRNHDKLRYCLQPLLSELIDLKQNGIEIDGEIVPVCLIFLIGDSLGQNYIGSFVRNFSSAEFSCRYCPMSKTDFLESPHETKPLRKPEEYDECVAGAQKLWLELREKSLNAQKRANVRVQREAAEEGSADKSVTLRAVSKSAFQKLLSVNVLGVKYRSSPFNNEEMGFHVIGRQAPCVAHDLAEGIFKTVLPVILAHLIHDKQWFDLSLLNSRITAFKCHGSDAQDCPKPLKSLESLSGNAVENWNFMRLLPFIIGDLVMDEEDPYWVMYLVLKQITELVMAPEISISQVTFLEDQIKYFLSLVQTHIPNCLTPKQHYLCHYPELIMMYGPLIRLFTLRFESKHAFFKRVLQSSRNFINITYTMARKYMCAFAYDRSSQLVPLDIVYSSPFLVDCQSLPEDLRSDILENFNELKDVLICGTKYSHDLCVLIGAEGSTLTVGIIKRIFLETTSNKILFLLEIRSAVNSFSGYYIIQQSVEENLKLVWAKDLADYYPLPIYRFKSNPCISLKHCSPILM